MNESNTTIWQKHCYSEPGHDVYQCMECGNFVEIYHYKKEKLTDKFPYCPKCGRRATNNDIEIGTEVTLNGVVTKKSDGLYDIQLKNGTIITVEFVNIVQKIEKLEQHTNDHICRGSVHVDDMGRYDSYTDSFVREVKGTEEITVLDTPTILSKL